MAIELDGITSGYNLSKINTNFQKVEDYINDKVLHRADAGVAGEAMMQRDLDMNGYSILNADIDGSHITNDRALRVPTSEGYLDPLPPAEVRKGNILSFDINTGLPIVTAPASGTAVDVLNQLALPGGSGLVGYRYKNNPTSTLRTVSNKLDEYVSLRDFHCDENGTFITPGPTVDSRQYIQAAINYVNSNGGGTLSIPAGNWYVNSYGASNISAHAGIIEAKSNVRIRIEEGATILVNSSFFDDKSFLLFCGINNPDPSLSTLISNFHIEGPGAIDCMGDTNQMRTAYRRRMAIHTGNMYLSSFRGFTIQNGDLSNGIMMDVTNKGSFIRITEVNFINLVQESVQNTDFTAVYVNAPYTGVDNCYFFNSSRRAGQIACCVELHQPLSFLNSSTCAGGYTRFAFFGASPSETAFHYGARIVGNSAVVVNQFIQLWVGEGVIMTSGLIADNICTIADRDGTMTDPGLYSTGAFLRAQMPSWDGVTMTVSGVHIHGNSFKAPSNVPSSTAFEIYNTCGGLNIHDNVFDCKNMFRQVGTETTVDLTDVFWRDNDMGTSYSGSRAGINIFDMYFRTLTNVQLNISFNKQDNSFANLLFIPSTTSVNSCDFVVNPRNIAVGKTLISVAQAVKDNINNYFEYPVSTAMRSYNTANSTFAHSLSTEFTWVAYGQPLNTAGATSTWHPPAAYSGQLDGTIAGIGYNDTAAVNDWTQWVLLKSKAQ